MDVWKPTEHIKRRVPLSKSTEHRIVPLAPTYAFERCAHQIDCSASNEWTCPPPSTLLDLLVLRRDVLRPPSELSPLRAQQQDSYRSSLPASGRAPDRARGR